MSASHRMTDSIQRYLDAILRLEGEASAVRVKDLSSDLGLRKGSVSGALKTLRTAGLIEHAPYRQVRLTRLGRQLAEVIVGRNRTLADFLVGVLHLDVSLADQAARRMGPTVTPPVVEGMRRFMDWTASPKPPSPT